MAESNRLESIACGDVVIIRRHPRYGGPYSMTVVMVTPKRFTARQRADRPASNGNWQKTFRKSDGRSVGDRQSFEFVSLPDGVKGGGDAG